MKKEHKTLFVDRCIKCGTSMKSSNGTRNGGMVTSVRIDSETIFGTTCWQWSEQGTHNPLVVGSIPTGPTMKNILKSLLMKNIVDGFQDMKEISMEDAMRFYEEENIAEVIWTIR